MTETHTSLFTTLNENINDFSRFDFILRRFNDDAVVVFVVITLAFIT